MPSITTDDIPGSFDKIEHLYDFSLPFVIGETTKKTRRKDWDWEWLSVCMMSLKGIKTEKTNSRPMPDSQLFRQRESQ